MSKSHEKTTALLIIDCQHDFVDGSLACEHADEAISALISEINKHPGLRVCYSADDHSPENGSFLENGGSWPVHCVRGTRGAAIVEPFSQEIREEAQKPGKKNLFFKGRDDQIEEYSAFAARRESGESLHEQLPEDVQVSGIASEFCVRETCLDLKKAGFNVQLFVPGLAWVNHEEHLKNLEDLQSQGIVLTDSLSE